MLTDYHVHTNTSEDAKATVWGHCVKAAELGISEFCITNHHEAPGVHGGDYSLDEHKIKNLRKEIAEAKQYYNLRIKLGVEIGYYEHLHEELEAFIEKHNFDFVLGSVHVANNDIISAEEMFSLSDVIKSYREYFRLLKKAIESGYVDCVGHIDLPRKYMGQLDCEEYITMVADCLKSMKKNNVGFEINTSAWRKGYNGPYPSEEILKMLKEAGIKKVTIGSDSHDSSTLGYGFAKAKGILKKHGFEHFCTFSARKPIYNKIQ